MGLVTGVAGVALVGFVVVLAMGAGPRQVASSVTTPPTGTTAVTPPSNTAGNQQQPSAPGQPVNVSVGHLPPEGNPNAKVKIVEFADFRCPFCDQFSKAALAQAVQDYVATGKAALYFRHYAFLGPASIVASNAAECANAQGKFWAMHDYLYQNQPPESDTSMYTVDNLAKIAGQLGMNKTSFSSCLSANTYSNNVQEDFNAGQSAGVQGTPTTFVNGLPVEGAVPYAQFKSIIDQALRATS